MHQYGEEQVVPHVPFKGPASKSLPDVPFTPELSPPGTAQGNDSGSFVVSLQGTVAPTPAPGRWSSGLSPKFSITMG